MIVERVELTAREGMEDAFAAALRDEGRALLASGEGCRGVKIGRGVENPGKFLLLLEWDDVATHIAFTGSPPHAAFNQLIRPFVTGGAMEHFDLS